MSFYRIDRNSNGSKTEYFNPENQIFIRVDPASAFGAGIIEVERLGGTALTMYESFVSEGSQDATLLDETEAGVLESLVTAKQQHVSTEEKLNLSEKSFAIANEIRPERLIFQYRGF